MFIVVISNNRIKRSKSWKTDEREEIPKNSRIPEEKEEVPVETWYRKTVRTLNDSWHNLFER